QEVRRRDRSKKKASAARLESSSVGEPGLVESLLNKWKNITTSLFSQWKETSVEYWRIKELQLELEQQRLAHEEILEQ
ncbi:hypothetical protein Tco_0574592, partial [Tanacetum coccineum]